MAPPSRAARTKHKPNAMNTFIAFLRGVTPSGKNAVKMADVRRVLNEGGFANMRTWIQSGSTALQTPLDAAQTAQRVHDLLPGQRLCPHGVGARCAGGGVCGAGRA